MFDLFAYVVIIIGILFGVKLLFNRNKENVTMKNVASLKLINLEIIKNFESYISVLEYYMNKAYNIIFKDQIMIYSIEATKLDDIHFGEVSKQFAKLVLKLIGKTLQGEFEYLYGSKETLLFNITEYFNTRYEDDEIRKSSQQQLMENTEENTE